MGGLLHLVQRGGDWAVVSFTAETQFYDKKEFMSTDSNKQRLVSDELRKRGCTVVNAPVPSSLYQM